MKKYSFKIRGMRESDNKIVRFKDEMDVMISSQEFIEKFRGYVDDIARFKTFDGRKSFRSTDYAAIGIMDINDVYQEAYLAFFEAYNNLNWDKVKDVDEEERGAMVWGYLKKSTILGLERKLREKKDGIRVTEHGLFKEDGVNTNFLTKLFSRLEVAFSNNVEEVAMTKWETELVGMFLEVHMDEFLDLTRNGNRDLKKNERTIIKAVYGIDQPRLTYTEISDKYMVSQSTIRKVKERAIKRLQVEDSKNKIAYFLKEYRINTGANIEFVKNNTFFSDVLSQNVQ